MSRRRNAAIVAVFTYGQALIGMLLGLLVTRVVLHQLGRDLYGLWIASGALLAYAGLADLGVLSVLPWMIAEADGQKDPQKIRALLSNAGVFATAGGILFGVLGLGLWHLYPALLHLSTEDRAVLVGPVFLVIAATALAFPLRIFSALLTGLQDATFIGVLTTVQIVTGALLTLALTLSGKGLYGLAVGAAVPPLAAAAISLIRALNNNRQLLRDLPRPSRPLLRRIIVDGLGAWLAAAGFQLVAGTDPIILTYLGLRESVPSFSVSSRLALTLTQFAWILPDAALVGLAQLAAEATRDRVRDVVLAILRLHMIVCGAMAIAVLASNAAFVRIWVGADFFLGARFNAILATNVVVLTAIHAVCTVASVLGKRLAIGLVVVANGAAHLGLALFLGASSGPGGIVVATLISGSVTCLPVGLILIKVTTDIPVRDVFSTVYLPWALRFLPIAAIALALGYFGGQWGLTRLVPCCIALGSIYLWWMKPLYRGLPLGPRVESILRRIALFD